MKYTEEEIKAMYEYDKYEYYKMILYEYNEMIERNFMDFDEYRKMFKKALKKAKYLSFRKILANIVHKINQ